jgi:hypothetical protein
MACCNHRERVLHEVAPGRADAIGERLAEERSLHARAILLQGHPFQPHVSGGMLAEADDPAAKFARALSQ